MCVCVCVCGCVCVYAHAVCVFVLLCGFTLIVQALPNPNCIRFSIYFILLLCLHVSCSCSCSDLFSAEKCACKYDIYTRTGGQSTTSGKGLSKLIVALRIRVCIINAAHLVMHAHAVPLLQKLFNRQCCRCASWHCRCDSRQHSSGPSKTRASTHRQSSYPASPALLCVLPIQINIVIHGCTTGCAFWLPGKHLLPF